VSSDGQSAGAALSHAVAAALATAEIAPSKLGPARHALLTDAERALYFWILRQFATDGRPGALRCARRPSGSEPMPKTRS
jgi:hypothetical protein